MKNWHGWKRRWIAPVRTAICLGSALCCASCRHTAANTVSPSIPDRPAVLAAYDWQRIPTGVTNAVFVPASAGPWAHVLSDHAVEVLLDLPPPAVTTTP